MSEVYFYHVTPEWWGPSRTLTPLSSDDPRVSQRGYKEPKTPRICVGPTVPQCFVAIPYSRQKDYHIYRTEKPVRAIPVGSDLVYDASVTEEHWLLEPTKFKFWGLVTVEVMRMFPSAYCGLFVDKLTMIINLAEICKILKDDGSLWIERPERDPELMAWLFELESSFDKTNIKRI